MVAHEQSPLTVRGYFRRLSQNVGNGEAIFLADRHINPRHQREVICHLALVAFAEISRYVLGPLIGFSEQKGPGCISVELGAQPREDRVSLGKIVRCWFPRVQ